MASRPGGLLNEAVAQQILADEPDPTRLAVMLADEILARGGFRANSCKPLLRAYEMAREQAGLAPVWELQRYDSVWGGWRGFRLTTLSDEPARFVTMAEGQKVLDDYQARWPRERVRLHRIGGRG